MALSRLGDVVFNVNVGEELQQTNEITNYPVEDGTNVNDNIDTNPRIISFSGIIHKEGAVQKLQLLNTYTREGTLLTYIGRNVLRNVVIESILRIHDNTIRGGFIYQIILREIQISQLETISVDFNKIFRPVQKSETSSSKQAVRNLVDAVANNEALQRITTAVEENLQPVGGIINRVIDVVDPLRIANPFLKVFDIFRSDDNG